MPVQKTAISQKHGLHKLIKRKKKCKLQSAAGNAPQIWTSVFRKRRCQTLWSSITYVTPPFI